MKLVHTGIALMITFSLVACGSNATSKDNRSNADLLKEATSNMKALKSYILEVSSIEDSKEYKGNAEMDVANNRFRMSSSGPDGNFVMIQINNDAFSSFDGGQTFLKGTNAQAARSNHDNRWKYLKTEDIDKAKDSLKDGSPTMEQIGGVDAKHIVVSIRDLQALSIAGSNRISVNEGTIDAWVSIDAQPLLLRMIVMGKDGGISTQDTATWSHFNETLNIQPPPTQQIQAPSN